MKLRWILLILLLGCFTLSVIGCSSGEDDDDDTGDDDDNGDDDDDTGNDDDDDDLVTTDTWTDPSSGLTWQVIPPSDKMQWENAQTYCENLSLEGGGWHLPTINELRTLIRGCDATEVDGTCGVSENCLDDFCADDSCSSCEIGDGPNNGCFGPPELPDECGWYWSSSAVANLNNATWIVGFDDGFVLYGYGIMNVRCVR